MNKVHWGEPVYDSNGNLIGHIEYDGPPGKIKYKIRVYNYNLDNGEIGTYFGPDIYDNLETARKAINKKGKVQNILKDL